MTAPLPSITATIPVGDNPGAMVVSPDGKYLYVACYGDCTVTVVDTADNQPIASIPCPAETLSGAAISPDGRRLYLSDVSVVLYVDTTTRQPTGSTYQLRSPQGLALSADGQRLYTALAAANAAAVIDTTTNRSTAKIKVGEAPYKLALSPDESHLYVANSDNSLSVIKTANHQVTHTIAVDTPFGVAVSPDGAHVYVANNYLKTVSVIKAASNTVVATIPVGDNVRAPVVSPNGARLYVVGGEGPATVSIIDTTTHAVIATCAAGNSPNDTAISRDGSTVYVSNNQSPYTVTAVAVAPAPIPRPNWSETLVAQVLVGVINDAGGWVKLGGKVIRVPPRQPVEAILAALPSQLAKRLAPLLKAEPEGAEPETTLRQQLSKVVAEYQKQRG
jgi:YVTN family beta-propeller protein